MGHAQKKAPIRSHGPGVTASHLQSDGFDSGSPLNLKFPSGAGGRGFLGGHAAWHSPPPIVVPTGLPAPAQLPRPSRPSARPSARPSHITFKIRAPPRADLRGIERTEFNLGVCSGCQGLQSVPITRISPHRAPGLEVRGTRTSRCERNRSALVCGPDPPPNPRSATLRRLIQSVLTVSRSFSRAPRLFSRAPRSFFRAPRLFLRAPRSWTSATRSWTGATQPWTGAPRSFFDAPRSFRRAPQS